MNQYEEEIYKLKAELTKARELFEAILDDPRLVVAMPSVLLIPIKELLAYNVDESCGQDAEAAKGVFNDPVYNAESDARNAAAMLEEVLEFYDDGVGRSPEEFKLMRKIGDWLGRSVAEIEHETDDCAHSEANKIGCPECGKVFKP